MNEHCTSSQHPKWFGLAVQAIVFLSRERVCTTCPSVEIAGYLQTEPSLLRRVLAVLAKEGFIETREGRDGGYRLRRSPDSIQLAEVYDVFRAGSRICLGITETAGDHPFGVSMKSVFEEITQEMDDRMREVLAKITIADLIERLKVSV
ncbi:RrF2 family transcriptional regulator [Gorillibacterium massiliense]|uniref:RrF2 family transcriptional regulator n=1 Tax=Gorillibacterium massiliense TaxID=1280390 RepID=UPI0004AD3E1E|nr:Rrf2 family transcriptional regulator [Gorillibacterium massiliense]